MAAMRRMNRMVLAGACASLFSCHETSAPWNTDGLLTIITDQTEYQRSQKLLVTIRNGTDRLIYDDKCGGEVQGFEYVGKWNGSFGDSHSCGLALLASSSVQSGSEWRSSSIAIQPGGSYTDSFVINSAAYPGTWRVELSLRDENGEPLRLDQRISNLFRVRLPSE